MSVIRVAVVASHPVQYHAHWFRALEARPEVELEVLYCHQASASEQAGAGFGVEFDWDMPLLGGYRHRFLRNAAREPSVLTFSGVDSPEIGAVLRRARYDAVIVLGWQHKAYLQAIWACKQTRTPVLVRSDSHLRTHRSRFRSALKWAPYRWFIRGFDGCLAVGTWAKQYFLHYGADPDSVFIVPHSADVDRLSGEAAALAPYRSELRGAWDLSAEDPVFLFAAKFIERKRPLDFLEAIRRASYGGARLSGLMVGDGPLRGTCAGYAGVHSLPVRFAGFLNQAEIVRAYTAADALVLPSDGSETWGLVVNEAMSCGRPAFVSDRVGCGPDLVVAGTTGAIFPLMDVDYLARLLAEYSVAKEKLAAMGTRARALMEANTPAVAAMRTVEAVERVVSRKGSRGRICR